jgi:HD superfamily phosphohydrolase
MTKEPNPESKRENLLRIIKNETENDKSRKYTESSLSAFFSLESFKEWLNEANQIMEKGRVVLRENFLSNVEATPEQVYEKFYRSDLPQNSIIGLSSSEPSLPERTEKKTDNQEIGYNRNLEALVNQIEKVERLEGKYEDKCFLCGYSGRMDYQITRHDQTWALLCGACGIKLCERLSKA